MSNVINLKNEGSIVNEILLAFEGKLRFLLKATLYSGITFLTSISILIANFYFDLSLKQDIRTIIVSICIISLGLFATFAGNLIATAILGGEIYLLAEKRGLLK